MKKILFILIFILSISFVQGQAWIEIDNFDRANSATVGNGWTETEPASTSMSIESNKLKFDDGSASSYPSVSQSGFAMGVVEQITMIWEYSSGSSYLYMYQYDAGSSNCINFRWDKNSIGYHTGATWSTLGTGYTNSQYNFTYEYNWGSNNWDLYIDGVETYTALNFRDGASCNDIDRIDLGQYSGAPTSVYYIDEIYKFNSTATPPSTPDTTSPSITNINQNPQNLTSLNAITDDLKINATITDNVLLNQSSIKLRLNVTHIEQFILGQDVVVSQREIDYTTNLSNNFEWELDESLYMSYTSNLPLDYFNSGNLLNDSLDSGNHWLKIKFTNVSNSARLMFTEIMDSNNTGIAEYYLCNNNYTTGNPVSNEWCTQFHVQSDTDLFHAHDQEWHRLMPMAINITSGKLNDVYVTQESYILKKGSGTGEIFYYANNNTQTVETTNNNGNSWSSQSYTVNAHIHQIHEEEYFEYSICAEDNETNRACSGNFTEQIDYPIIPPFPSQFETPVFNATYNTSIQIEYTKATSLTSTPITGYKLEYRAEDDSTWTTIVENNYPNTDYNWNIENRLNGIYYLRIIAEDQNNLTAITISPLFNINNPVGQDIQLLTDILAEEEQQTTTINNIYGVLNMLWYVILNLGILTAGFYLTLNYNHQFGIPYIFAGNLMMFKYIIDSFGWGTWIGYIFVGLIFVSIMAMFSMKSIRNRVLFHKK